MLHIMRVAALVAPPRPPGLRAGQSHTQRFGRQEIRLCGSRQNNRSSILSTVMEPTGVAVPGGSPGEPQSVSPLFKTCRWCTMV
jgi:hypothetical protein